MGVPAALTDAQLEERVIKHCVKLTKLGVFPTPLMLRDRGCIGEDSRIRRLTYKAFGLGVCSLPMERIPYPVRAHEPFRSQLRAIGRPVKFVKPTGTETHEDIANRRREFAAAETKPKPRRRGLKSYAPITRWALRMYWGYL